MQYLPEKDLLVFLLDKEFYNIYFDSLDLGHVKDNYRELHHIYLALKECHSAVEHNISLPDLQAWFFTKYPDLDKELYLYVFKDLSETPISPGLGLHMLKAIKARKQALKLSEQAFNFSNGNGEIESIVESYTSFLGEQEAEEEEFKFVTTSLSDIVANLFLKPGLRWRLDALNKSLGSLRKGNFGFLFARPESGKTTFLASEITHMLTQLKEGDGSVIWLNNEQPGQEVMLRVYQAYFGVRLEQLRGNFKKYEEQFLAEVGDRFKLVDEANIEKHYVERLCRKLKPSLLIFDQIDKIKGFNADREDLRLGAIYIWARELAKAYCPVIGICQADGTAEGQKWLTMDHVANAKTSKQAEADWILGMGNAHAEGTQFIRYLNLSKNKLLGDSDTLSKYRHGHFEILIEPEIARFKDIIEYN